MKDNDEALKYVSKVLMKDNLPVTFRTLSRELNIHYKYAKRFLQEYYESNKDQVQATFIITGKGKNGRVINLIRGEEELAKSKSAFEAVEGVEIFSLCSNDGDSGNEVIVLQELKHNVDLSKRESYYALGVIEGPELVTVSHLVQEKPDELRSSSRPKTDLSTYYTSRKAETAKKPAKRTKSVPTPSGYVYKSRKVEKDQPKERVIQSAIDDDDAPLADQNNNANSQSQKKSDLSQLFMDDFSDDSDQENEEKPEPILVQSTENPAADKQSPVPEKHEVAAQSKKTSSEKPLSRPSQKTATPEPPKSDSIDENGYITSYRKNNPAAKLGKRKTNQTSLMNFFKPKQ